MRCTQCHEREAVVFLTQIAQDQVVKLHLCERCAAEKGVETTASLGKTPVGTFLASMGKGLEATQALPAGIDPPEACPTCGATLSDFRESGRLGCAECYRTFAPALRDLLRRLHGSSRHLGERYAVPGAPAAHAPEANVAQLRKRLRLAVETEDFELAAELRDQLRILGGDG
ncbi:MAG TPA: UvrB/UvrC motif-containing protein [Gemmatimonadales bacterium]|nr:UvrB/UvrC motif-containing protein [Gemmatimonadales bacterium]